MDGSIDPEGNATASADELVRSTATAGSIRTLAMPRRAGAAGPVARAVASTAARAAGAQCAAGMAGATATFPCPQAHDLTASCDARAAKSSSGASVQAVGTGSEVESGVELEEVGGAGGAVMVTVTVAAT